MTTLPKTKSELKDAIRRETAFQLAPLAALCKEPVQGSALRKRMRLMLPEYSIQVENEKPIWMPVLHTKQKGKHRIYSNVNMTDVNPDSLYLSYLSKKDVENIVTNGGSTRRAGNMSKTAIIELLGDKWCVTNHYPAAKFTVLDDLFTELIAYEATSSKANHPPVGDTKGVWKLSYYAIDTLIELYPFLTIGDKIVCTIKRNTF